MPLISKPQVPLTPHADSVDKLNVRLGMLHLLAPSIVHGTASRVGTWRFDRK